MLDFRLRQLHVVTAALLVMCGTAGPWTSLRAAEKPLIRILATGGTIANTAEGRVPIEDVLDEIRRTFPDSSAILDSVEFEIIDLIRVGSHNFSGVEFLTIAKAANEALAEDSVDAVIVTQGTYVAEETAYLLNLLVKSSKPVIIVCSQRPHGSISNDGDRNLIDAVRVALSAEASGKGVMLVTNQTISSGREVVKTSSRPDAFSAGIFGALGIIEFDGSVTFYRSPTRRHTYQTAFDVSTIDSLPKVEIISAYYDADPALITALTDVEGLVIHGYTMTGDPHPGQEAALEAMIDRGVPVVLTARGGVNNRVPVNDENRYIEGDSLVSYKARILLQLALTRTRDHIEIQRMFLEY